MLDELRLDNTGLALRGRDLGNQLVDAQDQLGRSQEGLARSQGNLARSQMDLAHLQHLLIRAQDQLEWVRDLRERESGESSWRAMKLGGELLEARKELEHAMRDSKRAREEVRSIQALSPLFEALSS